MGSVKKKVEVSDKKAAKLTPKQERFCREYILDFNGSASAIRAGFSAKTAKEQAHQMLSNVKVSEFITELQKPLIKKLEDKFLVSKERVLELVAKIAFADMRGLYDNDGNLKKVNELSADDALLIMGIESQELNVGEANVGSIKKVKTYDKIRAAAEINKMMGYYEPIKQDHTTQGESLNKGFYDFLKSSSTDTESE
jgi:phage terminase small subunit